MEMDNGINEEGAVSAIIVAAGKGSRTGLGYNKVLAELGGIPMLERTARAFIESGLIHQLILVIGQDDEEQVQAIIRKLPWEIQWTYGGSERQESVYNGLKLLSGDTEIVLIHDAARPFVDETIIRRSIEGARNYGAACVGMPVKDTVKQVDPEGFIRKTPDRTLLWNAQTPQAFRKEIILKAHEYARQRGIKGTDDAVLAEHIGVRVKMVEGSGRNIKITSKEDLLWAETILKSQE